MDFWIIAGPLPGWVAVSSGLGVSLELQQDVVVLAGLLSIELFLDIPLQLGALSAEV